MKIILLSGKARSGKDSFYKIAKEYIEANYTDYVPIKLAFADEVKNVAKEIGWNGEKDAKGRSGLQMIGDGARNYFDEDVWIKKLIRSLYLIFHSKYYINKDTPKEQESIIFITDCRYLNEILKIKEWAGVYTPLKTIRITRPYYDNGLTEEQKNNKSETGLDYYNNFDTVIVNDGSFEYYKQEVIYALKSVLGED